MLRVQVEEEINALEPIELGFPQEAELLFPEFHHEPIFPFASRNHLNIRANMPIVKEGTAIGA